MSIKQMRMRTLKCVSLAGVVLAATSCGDVVRSSRSPVLLLVHQVTGGTTPASFLLSDVIVNRTAPLPCSAASPCPTVLNDPGSATLAVSMKDASITAPTSNNSVTITRYRVEYRRADGRNTPGIDVPYAFDGATTVTIAAGATGSVGFELVRHTSKSESPLVQLINSPNVINTIAEITFYGNDAVGNDVSATGSIQVNFGNFGDSQ